MNIFVHGVSNSQSRLAGLIHSTIPFTDVKYLIKCFAQNKCQENCIIEYNNKLYHLRPNITSYLRKTYGLLSCVQITH